MRDYALGTTFDIKFTSRRFTTGAPFTLAGSPAISAYPDNSTTQLTAGITLSVDFDSVTGLNNIRVVATGGNGYAAGVNYALVITAGTVDSVSVVGEVVGEFSLEAQSPLRPTTAGRTLDVSAGGEAGVDWANVGSPTTALGLTGTTIKTATDVETDTQDIQARLPAALTGAGNIKADALAWNGLTTVALPLIPTTAGRTLDVSATGEAGLDWANIGAPTTAQGLTGTTIAVSQIIASVGAAGALAIADALLNRDMSAVSDTNARTPLNALRFLRNKRSTSGGVLTVTEEDDTTTAWTAALTTDAAAVPVITVDPA